LPRLAEVAATVEKLMTQRGNRESVVSWIEHAKPVIGAQLAARGAAIGNKYDHWTAHGDFNVENLLLDMNTNRLTVIDWEFVRSGLPPLFDVFTLFFAVVDAVVPSAAATAEIKNPVLAQFYTAFFDENEWSSLFKSCTDRARGVLGIEPTETWDLFVDFMILRVGYLVERKSVLSISRIGFISAICNWKDRFQL